MFKPRTNIHKAKRRQASSESSDNEDSSAHAKTVVIEERKRVRHGIPDGSHGIKESEHQLAGAQTTTSGESVNIVSGEEALRAVDNGDDQRSQYDRNRLIQRKLNTGELDEGVYRGLKAYRAYVEPDDARLRANAKVTGALGPQKSAANVRSTARFDYQMDVCKDYKESGYCGFGDSCKFWHDRSDYKSGWQLESEWNSKQKQLEKERFEKFQKLAEKKRLKLEQLREEAIQQGLDPDTVALPPSAEDDNADDDVSVKEKCCVCGKIWSACLPSSPCMTICGHYFCESCFAATSTSSCRACGKPTQGIFNSVV